MGDIFSGERFIQAIPQILKYFHVAIEFLIICAILSTIFAFLVAALRIRKIPVLDQVFGVFISYMRGTPFLMQMMVVYYGLPLLAQNLLGVNIDRWAPIVFAEIALILNQTAFFSEVIRGAILSIPAIQTEAAYSIGMTRGRTFLRIIFPQTVRVLIPSFGTMIAGTFQSSAILYMVGVMDMMGRAKSLNALTGHSLEAYTVVALVYILFNLLVKFVFDRMEIKMNYGGR